MIQELQIGILAYLIYFNLNMNDFLNKCRNTQLVNNE